MTGVAVTDWSGAAIQINSYDEYGAPAPGNAGRFGYTGQVWLPETGLYHYKNRAYHPELGRFMQTDPIGVNGGMNLYAYVGGDPVNFVDPLGLECRDYYPEETEPDGSDKVQDVGGCLPIINLGGIGGANFSRGGLNGVHFDSGPGGPGEDDCPEFDEYSGGEDISWERPSFRTLEAALAAAASLVEGAQRASTRHGRLSSYNGETAPRHARAVTIYGGPGEYRISPRYGNNIPWVGSWLGDTVGMSSALTRRGFWGGIPDDNLAVVTSSAYYGSEGGTFITQAGLSQATGAAAIYRATNGGRGVEILRRSGGSCRGE